MNKRLAMTIAGVGLVGVIGIGATLAYLTDITNEVTNTFTSGDVEFHEPPTDKHDPLGHGLWESEVGKDSDDVYTQDLDGDNEWTKIRQDYIGVMPGDKLLKDPTVILDSDSQNAYVVAKVTYNHVQFAEPEWTSEWTVRDTDVNGEYTTVYLLHNGAMSAGQRNSANTGWVDGTFSTIFTSVTVDSEIKTVYKTVTDATGTHKVIDHYEDKNGKTLTQDANGLRLDDIVIQAAAVQERNLTADQGYTEAKALFS